MAKTVYEVVTDKVLEAMAGGRIPWQKPWSTGIVRPCNAVTGRPYSGGNMFLLSMLPYAVPAFLTFNQIKKAGATIKEGHEKAYFPVFFWKRFETLNKATGKKETGMMLRYFLVWNVEQVEGFTLPGKLTVTKKVMEPIAAAEHIVANMPNPPKMAISEGDKACYYPGLDRVCLPCPEQFHSPGDYYQTTFHELAHSTGHASRLNRKEVTNPTAFGSHDYSVEELVAELTAAFLSAECGIDNTLQNSAAYIQGWMKRLRDDTKMFWTAAGRAQKAADYILNRKKEEETETETETEE